MLRLYHYERPNHYERPIRRDEPRLPLAKTIESRDLLSPVYGLFTERFDTADLKEAGGDRDGQEPRLGVADNP